MVKPARKSYNPVLLESEIQETWGKRDAYKLTRSERKQGKDFYFIDGPPYTTGYIHLGTAWNKTLKDAVVRYLSMNGHNVRDQAGYDMHGLPIEVQVERELGIKNKKEIEAYGIENFVNKCRDYSVRQLNAMTGQFKRLGVWLNWDDPYMTIRPDYMEGAWWALRQAHEKGLLYEAERSITWCRRCATALAAAELEYQDREDLSVTVKFPVRAKPGEFLLIWTTTPWTLPANCAIAAHPDFTYAKVLATTKDGKEETLVLAEKCVDAVIGRNPKYSSHYVVGSVTGKELEGTEYEHPFAKTIPHHATPKSKWNNKVILATYVTEENTGLVHTAPGHGAEDFESGEQYGIAAFCPVDESGNYTNDAGTYAGTNVADIQDRIVGDLEAAGLLVAKQMVTHSYGHCWRCKTPIIYRATKQWFIEVTKVKGKMLSEVDRIKWTPDWAGSARQKDWVEGARDWCISRQRYWGIPLPVWRCREGHVEVLGTRKEMRERATNFHVSEDIHRPWIDEVTISCKDCGDTMHRVPDVLDVWFDSAVASWAELSYPSKPVDFERWWPADWIVEGLDQTRGWFYSQLGAGVVALGKVPYKSVLMHGFVHDAQGRPMHKSLGNVILPHEVTDKHGVDSLRFYFLSVSAPWEDIAFNVEGVKTVQRMLNILWNVHYFATTYMALDGFDPVKTTLGSVKRSLRQEDRWLYSRLDKTIEAVTEGFKTYDLHKGSRALSNFVLEDLSRWYVRLTRDRTWVEGASKDKLAAYRTLYDALMTTAKLLAPIAPHISDAMHEDLKTDDLETVHMRDWPKSFKMRDEALETQMGTARELVEAASNARQKASMKLRWPVAKIIVAGTKEVEEAIKSLEPIVLDQTNAKKLEFVGQSWENLVIVARPVKNVIGPAFKKDAPSVREAIEKTEGKKLRTALEKDGKAKVKKGKAEFEVTAEMVTFTTALPDSVVGADFTGGSVYVDTVVSEALKAEALSRELIRRVQEMRKEMGLNVEDRITVEAALSAESEKSLKKWTDHIASETRATKIVFAKEPKGSHVKEWELEDERITLATTKIEK